MAANFDFIRRLGSGHFGEVWLATDTGLAVQRAIKLIPPDKIINPSNFFQEAQFLKKVEHPSIVRVEETGTLSDGTIYVAMEYVAKGSLEDEAKGSYVPLTRAKRLMIDVLRGLEYAHSQGIIHRDIKPANILIGDALQGKLSDFGLAITKGAISKSIGVKDYAYLIHLAPEVSTISDYSILSDIFACGVTFYRLVNGDRYLPHLPLKQVRERIANGTYPDRRKYREFVPHSLRLVINKAMSLDPHSRYKSAETLRHAIEKVPTLANWNEQILPDRFRWTIGRENECVEVERIKLPTDKFSVQTRKGGSRHSLRRVGSLCKYNISENDAMKLSQAILQGFVIGNY
jgi:serine/threonine protein kinase